MNENLSVSIGGEYSGFQRALRQVDSLLGRLETRASQAGRSFAAGFGGSVTNTTTKALGSIDLLNNRIALLTQRRNLSLDTSVIVRTNREIAALQAKVDRLSNKGLPQPSSGAIGGLTSYASGLLSISAAFAAVKTGLGIISDFDRLDRKLQAVSTSQADFGRSQYFNRELADRLGLSVQTLTNSYAGLKAASEGTALAGKQTDFIFEAITRRAAKLGLTTEQTEGSLLAIAQMMSKGTIQAEELRGQLSERLPGAFNQMARALGVTTAELGKMLEGGQVLAEDALPKLAKAMLETAEGAERNATSMAGGFQRVKDQTAEFIAQFGKTSGIDTFFGKLSAGMADYLKYQVLIMGNKSSGGYLDDFTTADRDVKQEKFDALRRSIRSNQARQQANEAARRALGQSPRFQTEEGQAEIAKLDRERKAMQDSQRELLQRQREYQRIARAGVSASTPKDKILSELPASATAKTAPPFDYAKNYENTKKQYDALKAKENGLLIEKKKLSAEDAKQLAILEKKLALADPKKYGPKPVKTPALREATSSALSDDEQLLRRLQANIYKDSQRGIVNEAQVGAARALAEHIKEGKEAAKGIRTNLDFLDKVSEVNITGRDSNGRGDAFRNTGGFKQAELLGTPTLPSTTGSFGKYGSGVSTLLGRIDADIAQVTAKLTEIEALKDQARFGMKQAGVDMLVSFGEGLAMGENPLKSIFRIITGFLGDFAIKTGAAILLAGQLETTAIAAAPFLAPLFALTGPAKIVTGAAFVAGGAALKALPFADGGSVIGPGTGTSDSILARLSNGEFVMKAEAVKRLGTSYLDRLNAGAMPAFAMGGPVGAWRSPQMTYNSPENNADTAAAAYAQRPAAAGTSVTQVTLGSQVKGSDLYLTIQRQRIKNSFYN